jgi:hypothetical protein
MFARIAATAQALRPLEPRLGAALKASVLATDRTRAGALGN